MRKIAFILLCLVAGLLCGTQTRASDVPCTVPGAQAGFTAHDRDELLCEREYNSDLCLPRPAAEVQPVRTVCVRLVPEPVRCGVKCGIAGGRCGSRVDALPEFTLHPFLSGAGAADYYVYRLHRLII